MSTLYLSYNDIGPEGAKNLAGDQIFLAELNDFPWGPLDAVGDVLANHL